MVRVSAYYPWMDVFGESAIPLILCGGFGMVGGSVRVLWEITS